MGPGRDLLREFWSLALWWAVWSLWDTYLLHFSPWFELLFLACCGGAGLGVLLWNGWHAASLSREDAEAKLAEADVQTELTARVVE